MNEMPQHAPQKNWLSAAARYTWDLWCALSVVGIWPRYIEPNLLATNVLRLQVAHLHPDLQGLRLIQFSDLHLHPGVSDRFLGKIVDNILRAQPDIILFTGDFLCNGQLEQAERLQNFLCALEAKYGCYAILGNHDFEKPLSVDLQSGDYDIVAELPLVKRISQRFFHTVKLSKKVTPQAQNITPHPELLELLSYTPFTTLENATVQLQIGQARFNLCGLGEYMAGRADIAKAFANWDETATGVILAHNPDCLSLLDQAPPALVLCGHTHGGQVNLPWLWKRFTLLEIESLRRGLQRWNNRWVYTNRGVGSVLPFRLGSFPEVLLVVLEAPGKL